MAAEASRRANTEHGAITEVSGATDAFFGKADIDVVAWHQQGADVAFLIRIRQNGGNVVEYHIKRIKDFYQLDENIRRAQAARGTVITKLPDLPRAGSRFGIRRRLSSAGLSPFLKNQAQGLQVYCEGLSSQLPSLSADSWVEAFFGRPGPGTDDGAMYALLMKEAFRLPTMQSMKGYWRLKGSRHLWTVQTSGHVLLNGDFPGPEFSITERGVGDERTFERLDGWVIDIPKSKEDELWWTLPGGEGVEDIQWLRESEKAAKEFIWWSNSRRASQGGSDGSADTEEAARAAIETAIAIGAAVPEPSAPPPPDEKT